MKAIKTLLAVSVLAVAGAANAATIATGDLTVNGAVPGVSSSTGTGTLTLSDAGVLTAVYTVTSTVLGTNTMSLGYTDTLNGTTVGGVYTPTSGSSHVDSCSPISGNNFCSFATNPATNTFATLTGSFTVVNGGAGAITGTYTTPGGTDTINYTISNVQTPTVPVPAAAWLFGSGLLGLAGTARRRRNA